jgi:hypothetical protein
VVKKSSSWFQQANRKMVSPDNWRRRSMMAPDNPIQDPPGLNRKPIGKSPKPDGSFRKGGKVKKTGVYKLHKGERVKTPDQTKKDEKMLRKKNLPR